MSFWTKIRNVAVKQVLPVVVSSYAPWAAPLLAYAESGRSNADQVAPPVLTVPQPAPFFGGFGDYGGGYYSGNILDSQSQGEWYQDPDTGEWYQ